MRNCSRAAISRLGVTLAVLVFGAVSSIQAVEPYRTPRGQMRNVPLERGVSWQTKKLRPASVPRVAPFRKSSRELPARYARARYSGWRVSRR